MQIISMLRDDQFNRRGSQEYVQGDTPGRHGPGGAGMRSGWTTTTAPVVSKVDRATQNAALSKRVMKDAHPSLVIAESDEESLRRCLSMTCSVGSLT